MSWSSSVRRLAVCIVVAAVGTMQIAMPAEAAPRPASTPRPAPVPSVAAAPSVAATVLTWPQLGLPAGVTLTAANETQEYALPIPRGLTPTALTGVLQSPQYLGAGYLEVDAADGTYLGSVVLPDAASHQVTAPFRIPLSHVALLNGALRLGLVLRQVDRRGDEHCDPGQALPVTGLALQLSGTAARPLTIDEFFPSVLHAVTLEVDPKPTRAEEQTVLELSAALVAHYAPLPLRIDVEAHSRGAGVPAAPSDPFSRVVVISQTGIPTVSVVADATGAASVLVLAGSGVTLAEQAALFVGELSGLAQVPTATVVHPGRPVLNTATVYTFSQLGISASTTVLGPGTLSFGIDQGRVGGPLSSITVHLIARYTPLAPTASGSVTVSVEGVVLFTARLSGSGRLDTRFRIPIQLLRRSVDVQLALAYDPRVTCSPLTPTLSFSIDPRSTITIARLGKAAGGFSALPTAFDNGFQVAIQDAELPELRYAALSVAGMQSLTTALLDPEVVGLAQIRDSGLGALIVCDSAGVAELGLHPPLYGKGTDVTAAIPGSLRAQIPHGVGSVQSFADTPRNRTVLLVTTTAAWSLVAPLFTALDSSDGGGWAALTGDVYVAGAAAHPADLTLRDSGVGLFAPQSSTGWRLWFDLAGVVLLIVVLLAAGLILRRRRAAPAGSAERRPSDASADPA